MQKSALDKAKERYKRRIRQLLIQDDDSPLAIGCSACMQKVECGGIHVRKGVFDCLSFCCGGKKGCNFVCPNQKRKFAEYMRECGNDLSLSKIKKTSGAPSPNIPAHLVMLYGPGGWQESLSEPYVAIPLFDLIYEQGGVKFLTEDEMKEHYKVSDKTMFIASGVKWDRPLEYFWNRGQLGRREIVRSLIDIGLQFATSPNFSCFIQKPRWDNLTNMLRSATCWEEFMSEGLPSALHLNAITQHDWHNWAAFVNSQPALEWISFEFGTGGKIPAIKDLEIERIMNFRNMIDRDVGIIIRGAIDKIPILRSAYSKLVYIDTGSYIKTTKRQKAKLHYSGHISWDSFRTAQGQPLDDLFEYNIDAVRGRVMRNI